MTELRKIHVLHIVSGDLWAGAEAQLYTLAKTLHRQPGTRVSVVILNPGMLEQKLKHAGINVLVLDESTLNGFQILHQLTTLIRGLKPNVIHTHRNKENILGSIAARFGGNIPTLRTAHGAPEHSPAWYHAPKRIILFLDWFCGRFLQKCIIAVSDDLARILAKDYPPEKIHVIQNGIDNEQISQSAGNAKTKSDNFKIGIIGRMVPVKRIDLFIRSAHKLLEECPELNPSFHIFGDGPLRDELERLNRQFETHAQVHFEGHSNSMHTQLKNLDVLVMTSDHEGLPMTLLEAMVLKTPIIAHAVGGIPKLLDKGNCGVLVHEHTPSGYAAAINMLEKNMVNHIKLTTNAFNRVTNFYSAEQNARAYKNEYESLLNG